MLWSGFKLFSVTPRSAVGTPATAASGSLTGTQSLVSQHLDLKLLTWAGKFESSAKCGPHESGGR